jgi:hypothetical protein
MAASKAGRLVVMMDGMRAGSLGQKLDMPTADRMADQWVWSAVMMAVAKAVGKVSMLAGHWDLTSAGKLASTMGGPVAVATAERPVELMVQS